MLLKNKLFLVFALCITFISGCVSEDGKSIISNDVPDSDNSESEPLTDICFSYYSYQMGDDFLDKFFMEVTYDYLQTYEYQNYTKVEVGEMQCENSKELLAFQGLYMKGPFDIQLTVSTDDENYQITKSFSHVDVMDIYTKTGRPVSSDTLDFNPYFVIDIGLYGIDTSKISNSIKIDLLLTEYSPETCTFIDFDKNVFCEPTLEPMITEKSISFD